MEREWNLINFQEVSDFHFQEHLREDMNDGNDDEKIKRVERC